MLVSESLNMFKRGRDSRKALDVGMTQVWPDEVEKLQVELGKAYKVEGELDEWDDTFYFVIHSRDPGLIEGDATEFTARINVDELSLWGQKVRKKKYGDQVSANKMEKIRDISNIQTIADQIRDLRASLKF